MTPERQVEPDDVWDDEPNSDNEDADYDAWCDERFESERNGDWDD